MSQAGEVEDPEAIDVGAILLAPECGLKETEEFLDALQNADPKEICVDASEVEKMSAACVLTVLSAIKEAESKSGKVSIIKPAPAFVEAFSDLGFFQDLMKMEFRQ